MDAKIQVLMGLIRSQVTGGDPPVTEFLALEKEEQTELVRIARTNAVAQLVGDALAKDPRCAQLELMPQLMKETLLALNQVTKIDRERERHARVLEKAGIPYIQLKGARIRPFYPENWMRTSCDIDLLVPEEQVEQAAQVLVDQLGDRMEKRNFHDLSLFTQSGVHLELHFSLLEDDRNMDPVLSRVWEYSSPVSEGSSEYLQSAEFFMFHQIAHMVHHLVCGGCGIRPFVDLFLLRRGLAYREDEVRRLCAEAGIEHFREHAWELVDVWFDGHAHTEATQRLESYTLSGGIFGSQKNWLSVLQETQHGKVRYVLNRIFLPRQQMERMYPVLRERRYLMPVYQVRRWGKLLRAGKMRSVSRDIQILNEGEGNRNAEVQQMLRENGLL